MKNYLERLTLRLCRWLVDRADEAVHGWEVRLRGKAAMADTSAEARRAKAEVDPIASAAREKIVRKARRPRQPRLRYVGGQFVREETSR